jgi:hypothetical protein
MTTEYTQIGNDRFHDRKISPAGEGGGRGVLAPTPFRNIYYHNQSCSVRSS